MSRYHVWLWHGASMHVSTLLIDKPTCNGWLGHMLCFCGLQSTHIYPNKHTLHNLHFFLTFWHASLLVPSIHISLLWFTSFTSLLFFKELVTIWSAKYKIHHIYNIFLIKAFVLNALKIQSVVLPGTTPLVRVKGRPWCCLWQEQQFV